MKGEREYQKTKTDSLLRAMQKKIEKIDMKIEAAEDSFTSYLRQNSIHAKSKWKGLERKKDVREVRIGRPQPEYCELHEAMILEPKTKTSTHADHHHVTGKYRGWICHNCNTKVLPIIDYMRDNGSTADEIKDFLNLAVDYAFTDGQVLEKLLPKPKMKK